MTRVFVRTLDISSLVFVSDIFQVQLVDMNTETFATEFSGFVQSNGLV